MELLRELTQLQHERGFLDDETLREISARRRVPLYHLEGLVSFYSSFRRTAPPKTTIRICRDVTCTMADGHAARRKFREQLRNREDVEICEVSCLGRCDSAPAATINDVPLAPLSLSGIEKISDLFEDAGAALANQAETSTRVWQCDPYQQPEARYSTVRSLIAEEDNVLDVCVERLKASRLRGMGGAGFPTGTKWELVARESADTKYVICNADESEPGTFKDRVILSELPHLVIEGMLLAGLSVGATHGIVFVRHEYAREQQALETALAEARQIGVLGANATGSGQAFDIEIFVSPGGYILGEETALLEALEDKRGEPRNKPPYPGTHGLWGKPTLVNNVETFALATSIVHHGSDWWHEQGSGDFSGLKFISISGDVETPGVFEVPIGTTVAHVIQQAGGMKDGKTLKAFLPGGASSNFLTAAHVDTPLDFDSMKQAGSMLGTGALIVIAEGRDLFALATNIVRFFRNESCGKCVPCRLGSEKAVELLESVQARTSPPSELDILAEMGDTLEQTSICGLGQVALNPILSMMTLFPDDVPP